MDGRKQLVTYARSANLDWYFVSIRPYAETISNIVELRNWTILIVVLLLLAGAGLSLRLSSSIYHPIRVLLDKANAMQTQISRSSRVLQDSYLSHLLKGNAYKTAVSSDMKREWENRLSGPFLSVVLLKIDDYKTFRERYGAFDRELYRFAIGNIAQEILSRSWRIDTALSEKDEVAFILQSDTDKLSDRLYLLLGEIQDTVKNYYRISLSAGIGDAYASLSAISGSYASAQSYMNARLFLGRGCIVSAGTMPDRNEEHARYPAAIEKRLIDAVKLCQPADVKAEIAAFRARLSGSPYAAALRNAHFLVLGIIREFEYIAEWWGVDGEFMPQAMEDLRNVETLEDIERLLTGLCFAIVEILEENKKNLTVTKNAKIVEEIQRFVRERYGEHGLSLEAAADHVGLSSGYIGKLFKSMTGTTFNDYVTHIRMERAKQLLETTNDSVAQIGERVGVYNVPYFTTLFKKKYGITPSQYREQSARKAPSAG